MSSRQLPENGIKDNNHNIEITEHVGDLGKKTRIEQQQNNLMRALSLKPEKSSKRNKQQDQQNIQQSKNVNSKSRNNKQKDQDINNEERGTDSEQSDEQDEEKSKEKSRKIQIKKLITSLKNDIKTILILEGVEIFSGLAQYLEIKVQDDFYDQWEDLLLGFTTIYAFAITLLIAWFLKFIISRTSDRKIVQFYKSHFLDNWVNKYCVFIIIYITILDILRFEIYLMRMEKRLQTYFITLIVNQMILARLNKNVSNLFVFFSTLYMTTRYLAEQHDKVYIFIGSIIGSFALSIRYLNISEHFLFIFKKSQNQQIVNDYLKQFYHNMVSMMPQGILIIDESENLVYANKTTKKILSCKSKNQIIDALNNLIIKDLTKQEEMNTFDDQKSYRTFKTLKSFKSLRSNHPKKHPALQQHNNISNNNNNYNSNYNNQNYTNSNNTNNIGASIHDSESFVSAYQFQDAYFPSPNINQKQSQVLKPVIDKQNNQPVQQFQSNITHNLSFGGVNSSFQQKSQSNKQQTFNQNIQREYAQQQTGQSSQNQKQAQINQSIPHQSNTNRILMNLQSGIEQGVNFTSKGTTMVEPNTILTANQNFQEQKNLTKEFSINSKEVFQQQQIQQAFQQSKFMTDNQQIFNKMQQNLNMSENQINQKKFQCKHPDCIKKRKDQHFKYIQQSSQQKQKNFENLSVMHVISVLIQECVMKLRGEDILDLNNQEFICQHHPDLNEIYNSRIQNTLQAKQIDSSNVQDINTFYENKVINNNKSMSSSVKQFHKDKQQNQLNESLWNNQKNNGGDSGRNSIPRKRDSTEFNAQSIMTKINKNNHQLNKSQLINNTFKNNTELAQNSLSIRVQVKDKLIEITFIQCEANLLQNKITSSKNNSQNQSKNKKSVNNTEIKNQNNHNQSDNFLINNLQQINPQYGQGGFQKVFQQNNASKFVSSHQNYEQSNEKKKTAMILVFLEDITHEVYMKQLEDMNNYKMKMLSSISHELKTPLNCSINMLEQIFDFINSEEFKDIDGAQKIRDCLEPAQQSNSLLLYMIRDLIDLGTFELNEKFKYEFTKFDLKSLLQSCCDVMRQQGKVKGIDISLSYENELQNQVVSDENRIRQIIVNFLSNSLKFTPRNGKISIKAELCFNNNVKILVEDNGIGIPQKKIKDIFQLQNKEEIQRQRKTTHGIGIGLSVSYRLAQGLTIEEFKEKPIQVKSEEKKGSIFSFVIKNQDPSLIDETRREDDDEDDTEILQNHRISVQEEFNNLHTEEHYADKSQLQSISRHIVKNDIPEAENEEDKENNFFQHKKVSDSKYRKSIQYFPKINLRQGESIYEGNENIEDLSEIGLQQQQNEVVNTPHQFDVFEKYFQDDIDSTSIKSQKNQKTLEHISQKQCEQDKDLVIELENNINEYPPEHNSNQTINFQQKQQTNNKVTSITLLSIEENSAVMKKGNNLQNQNTLSLQNSNNNIGSNFQLNSIFNNISLQNSPRPYSNSSILNIEVQNSLDDFISQNLQRKEENFKEDYGQILIVDDVQFNLITLQNLLKKYQLKVDLAHDGLDAVNKVKEKYEQNNSVYKIIFMDLQMPTMDGFQATKKIKTFLNDKKANNVPIIATSAFADQQYKEHAKKVGMTDYIEKPIQITKIDKAIIKHVIK